MTSSHSANVLIVDDDPEFREILAFDFESSGYEVSQAENANAAIEALAKSRINVIVSDVRMPDGDGVMLLNRIAERKRSEGIILIFVTGFLDLSLMEAFDLGAEGFLLKPFDRRALISAVQRLLLPMAARWAQKKGSSCILDRVKVKGSIEEMSSVFALGRGGASFKTSSKLPEIDQIVFFNILFEAGPILNLRGEGQVRWKRGETIGVEFLYIDPEGLSKLANFIESQRPLPFIPKGEDSGK